MGMAEDVESRPRKAVTRVGPRTLWMKRSPIASVGFLQRFWEKADLGGRLAPLVSDGYVFTRSVHLLERPREVHPCINADIRTLSFSADVLVPLLRGHLSQEEKHFSHRGRAVTKKREGCGERK